MRINSTLKNKCGKHLSSCKAGSIAKCTITTINHSLGNTIIDYQGLPLTHESNFTKGNYRRGNY